MSISRPEIIDNMLQFFQLGVSESIDLNLGVQPVQYKKGL